MASVERGEDLLQHVAGILLDRDGIDDRLRELSHLSVVDYSRLVVVENGVRTPAALQLFISKFTISVFAIAEMDAR